VGCFSLRLKKNINWELFKEWKDKRYPSITEQIARDFIPFIRNHYDYITAAPPSARRHPSRYCVYDLALAISRRTKIPFVPACLPAAGRHSPKKQTRDIMAGSPAPLNKAGFNRIMTFKIFGIIS